MSKTATLRARLEPELKEKAEGVLGELGLNATTAITLYYEQIVRRHAIPFEISLPNVATLSAMRRPDRYHARGESPAERSATKFLLLRSDHIEELQNFANGL